MQFKISDWVVRQPPELLKSSLTPSAAPLKLVSRLNQGYGCAVVQHLTTWGWRKPHKPDRYNRLPENTGEPLSKIGDDG